MSKDEEADERSTVEGEQPLPPPRSVQAGSSLWWWFLVLVAIIGVWVVSMMFMRGPAKAADDDGIILLNPSADPSASP